MHIYTRTLKYNHYFLFPQTMYCHSRQLDIQSQQTNNCWDLSSRRSKLLETYLVRRFEKPTMDPMFHFQGYMGWESSRKSLAAPSMFRFGGSKINFPNGNIQPQQISLETLYAENFKD